MARAQAAPRPTTPPLATDYLYRRRRFLRERITRAIAAIDALLQDPAPSEVDLCASLDMVLNKQIELDALNAAIQKYLAGDKLKEEISDASLFDNEMRSFKTRASRHPASRAAMHWVYERTVRTKWVSANRQPMRAHIIPQGTHFVTLATVRTETLETLQEHFEKTMLEEYADNISAALRPYDSAFNAARDESSVTEPLATPAEDLAEPPTIAPIDPPSTGSSVFPNEESAVSDKNDSPSDDSVDVLRTPSSRTNGHAVCAFREGYLLPQGLAKLREPYPESKDNEFPCQPTTSSPSEMTHLEFVDDPQDRNTRHGKPHRQKLAPHGMNHGVVRSDAVPARRQTARHYFRSLPAPTKTSFSKQQRGSLFGTRRIPYKLRIRLGPKAPSDEARSTPDRDERKVATTNPARRVSYAAATVVHLPVALCFTRHVLVIKKHLEPPQLTGYPYDPGGYYMANGERASLLHREPESNRKTRHRMQIIPPSFT